MKEFFKKAFSDMKESAKVQHEVDKLNFEAVKAESKANWEEAKVMGSTQKRKEIEQIKRDDRIASAQSRIDAANARIEKLKNK